MRTFSARRLTGALSAFGVFLAASAQSTTATAAPPAPAGAHPRVFLTPTVLTALKAKAADPASQTSRVIKICDDVIANPTKWNSQPGFDFKWGVGATACAFAWQVKQDAKYRAPAFKLFNALLDDLTTVGDGAGGDLVVRKDTGYYIRLFGPYAGLAYDWLYGTPEFDAPLKAKAIGRFKAWVNWYGSNQPPPNGGYLPDEPGANYHAGYVFAKTVISIAMSGDDPAGATYFTDVVDNLFTAQIVGKGLAKGGVLRGGDWSEGWQYGPLSVLSYSLSARALAEQGATFPAVATWSNELALRFYHALTPNRAQLYVGGDFDDAAFNAAPHMRVPLATLVGPSSDEAAGWALFARKNITKGNEQIAFIDALAEARTVTAADLGSPTASKWYVAEGARRLYMRSGWDAAASWAAFVSSPHQVPDHEHADASSFNFYRGADALIVDATPYGAFSTLPSNALTVESESVGAEYKPSQAVWPNKAELPWARAGESGIVAARSELSKAFLGTKGAASDVPYAHREFAYLPEGDVVLIDRARTDAPARGLRVRFHASKKLTLAAGVATADVGASTLRIHGVEVGGQTATERMSPEGDCFSSATRGACENARFTAGEYNLRVPGPDARAVHVLSGTGKGEAAPQTLSVNDPLIDAAKNPAVLGAVVTRGALRTVVVGSSAKDGAAGASLSYVVPGGARHVVFDAPEAADGTSAVTAVVEGAGCRITVTPGAGAGAFVGRPLMFTIGAAGNPCAVSEDKVAPPGAAPIGPPGGNIPPANGVPGQGPNDQAGAGAGAAAGEEDSGCGCRLVGRRVSLGESLGVTFAGLAAVVFVARRRRRR